MEGTLLMASQLALRNELRSIVLRGVQRIRDIEIAREVAEFVLLEARMTIAASFDDDDDNEAPLLIASISTP